MTMSQIFMKLYFAQTTVIMKFFIIFIFSQFCFVKHASSGGNKDLLFHKLPNSKIYG